ncbi:MAG: hypothetical protein P8L28_08815 [Flavobacteriaceae bacterium]|nr:hypothetical protein [Flavobacteriaceae bacterium]
MMTILNILMIGLLLVIFYEDVKDRKVTFIVLIMLILLGGFIHSQHQYIWVFLLSLVLNSSIILTIISVLYAYANFKLKTSLSKVFGSGDALFFLVMAFSFPTATFLVLFTTSLFFCFVIAVLFKKTLNKTIPLAGLQALYIGLILVSNQMFHIINLYTI